MSTPTPAPADAPLPGAAAAPAATPDPGPSAVDRALAAVARLEAEHGPAFGGPPPAAPAADPKTPPATGGTPERDPKGRFVKPEPAEGDTPTGDAAEPGAEAGDEPDLSDDDLDGGAAAPDADPGDDDEDLGDEPRDDADTSDEGAEGDAVADARAKLAAKARDAVRRERAQLERDKASFQAEVAGARGALIALQKELGALDRLRKGDPDAFDELGVDVQELTLAYAQRGRPEAVQSKREKELAAKLDAQNKALAELQRAQFDAQEAQRRKQFTREAARDTTYVRTAALAKANPDRLYTLACARADELRARGVALTSALLLRGIERQLRDLGVPRPGAAPAAAPLETREARRVDATANPRAGTVRKTAPAKRPPAEGLRSPPAPPSPSAAAEDLSPEQRLARAIAAANAFGRS